jgi:XTP/dITP diphosphohydrolase
VSSSDERSTSEAPRERELALTSVLVATSNRSKLLEIRQILADLPVELVDLQTVLPGQAQVPEDGTTFEENATLKALAAARATQLVTLADDSGLEVDALGGRPGVRSARFAREGATDAENNAALLTALGSAEAGFVVSAAPTARFRCVVALVDPFHEEQTILSEGRCEGRIVSQARGSGGFGYDPLFLVDGFDRTLAELSADEKNAVSHRGKALMGIRPALVALLERRLADARRVLGP